MADVEEVSDAEKVRIASDFLIHSPPGEFNEVFNDIRVILDNDVLLKDGTTSAFSQYQKDQLSPVNSKSAETPCLLTEFNDLGGGRFADPRSKQSFHYNHYTKVASQYKPWEPDADLEPLRAVIETEVTNYTADHYKNGACSVFSVNNLSNSAGDVVKKAIVACIEHHQYQPRNYWNGRWRSIWTVDVSNDSLVEITGLLRVQVHYYEDGNVQLVSSKEAKEAVTFSSGEAVAKELVQIMESTESNYQTAIAENYQAMSDTTFKALRRQLPVTRTKVDWNKIVSYSIGKELKNQ